MMKKKANKNPGVRWAGEIQNGQLTNNNHTMNNSTLRARVCRRLVDFSMGCTPPRSIQNPRGLGSHSKRRDGLHSRML